MNLIVHLELKTFISHGVSLQVFQLLTRYIGVTLNRLCSVSAMTDVDSKDTEAADIPSTKSLQKVKSWQPKWKIFKIYGVNLRIGAKKKNLKIVSKFTNSHATIKL